MSTDRKEIELTAVSCSSTTLLLKWLRDMPSVLLPELLGISSQSTFRELRQTHCRGRSDRHCSAFGLEWAALAAGKSAELRAAGEKVGYVVSTRQPRPSLTENVRHHRRMQLSCIKQVQQVELELSNGRPLGREFVCGMYSTAFVREDVIMNLYVDNGLVQRSLTPPHRLAAPIH